MTTTKTSTAKKTTKKRPTKNTTIIFFSGMKAFFYLCNFRAHQEVERFPVFLQSSFFLFYTSRTKFLCQSGVETFSPFGCVGCVSRMGLHFRWPLESTEGQHCAVQHYSVLYCTVQHCCLLYCTVLQSTILYNTALHCTEIFQLNGLWPFSLRSSACSLVALAT